MEEAEDGEGSLGSQKKGFFSKDQCNSGFIIVKSGLEALSSPLKRISTV